MNHEIKNDEIVQLYNPDILKKLNFSKYEKKFNPTVSVVNAGPGLVIRPLCSSDHNSGFVQLLGQLTTVGDVSAEKFLKRFNAMCYCPNTYYVTVVEDTTSGEVVGSGTLVVEQKFIHGCALRGRIEDVVVSERLRGKQLGKLILLTLVAMSEYLGCYKVTLDCKDHMVKFYESLGLHKEQGNSNFMQLRFVN